MFLIDMNLASNQGPPGAIGPSGIPGHDGRPGVAGEAGPQGGPVS